jgi:hypothetical protein
VTQTILAAVPTQHATRHPSIEAIGPVLTLHGWDPLSGIPATWHVTSLAGDGASGTFLIERAEGEIHSPALWMQARLDAKVGGEDAVVSLVRSVMFA